MIDLLAYNREAWNGEVAKGNVWTKPVGTEVIEAARAGRFSLLLTPTRPVPREWFGELDGAEVLCLASGGGQQAPVLAAAGARVTVLDNSPAQLGQDRFVAEREGLSIRLELGDMRDLSRFPDHGFDLIFHPVSNVFVDDIRRVWRECARVLKPGGALLAGFVNPLLYIFDQERYDSEGVVEVRYSIPYSDVGQLPPEVLKARIEACEPLEFGHSLEDQIGGQLDAGFALTGFYEDTFDGYFLDRYIKTFAATRAILKKESTRF